MSIFLLIVLMAISQTQTQPQSQPGWTQTQGGEGGQTIHVTTLNSSGPGSLRAALGVEGPRVIVFDVAGVIDLGRSKFLIKNPYVTIAGETAPSPGITLIRGGINIYTHDVIVRHLRVRPGDAGEAEASGWEVDGMTTAGGAYDVIIDHCSVSWATDENISASGPRFEGDDLQAWRENTSHRITISHCIIAEGLWHATHSKGAHSRGSLIHDNTTDIAIIGNLYASNNQRNPMFKGGAAGIVANNLIHNPGEMAVHYNLSSAEWGEHEHVPGRFSVINNVLQPGPNTGEELPLVYTSGLCEVFVQGNLRRTDGKVQPYDRVSGSAKLLEAKPSWPAGFEAMVAEDVFESVLSEAGARPWDRDAVDQRIVAEVRAGTGSLKDSESGAEGYPH